MLANLLSPLAIKNICANRKHQGDKTFHALISICPVDFRLNILGSNGATQVFKSIFEKPYLIQFWTFRFIFWTFRFIFLTIRFNFWTINSVLGPFLDPHELSC